MTHKGANFTVDSVASVFVRSVVIILKTLIKLAVCKVSTHIPVG